MSVNVLYKVPFHDVDSLKIVWHGHYYKYFEMARTELYCSRKLDVADMQRMGYTFPVIESHCRYSDPLRYGQKIRISAAFREWKYYVMIDYKIQCANSSKRLAYGHTKQAVCDSNGTLLLHVPEDVVHVIAG